MAKTIILTTTLTQQEAAKKIIERCRVMARLNAMDNGIQPPTDEEMYLALEDSINYINNFPPETNIKIEDLFNSSDKSKYLTLVCLGTLKFTFEMLVAYISANLMDVVIDDFPISSRLSEYQNLSSQYGSELEQKLAAQKPIMGSVIRGGARTTKAYITFSGWISPNTENRYYKAMKNGGYY